MSVGVWGVCCSVKQTDPGFILRANLCKNDPENVDENSGIRGVI
jgi:hypothetical protein